MSDPQTFRAGEHDYRLELDYLTARQILKDLEIDLLNVQDGQVFRRLSADRWLAVDVVLALTADRRTALDIDETAFLKTLDEHAAEAMGAALVEAIIREIVRAMADAEADAIKGICDSLESGAMRESAKAVAEKAVREIEQKMAEDAGAASTLGDS